MGYDKQWYLANKQQVAENSRRWRAKNIDKYRAYQREYRRKRRAEDEEFHARCNRHSAAHAARNK